ncbi:MAG TPA: cytochrome c oxidase subunit II [Gaiellaceae bacterium]|nr:cytochrome c oxidase subunit II [Gaiellaceae bacterium]
MRRGSIIQLTAIGLVAGAICTVVALAIPWLPVAGGEEAGRIHFVYWFTTVICICVFSVVAAVLIYSVWKFRVGPDDDSDGPPTHGHTKLEVVWTAIPAVLVTAISIVSAIVLAQNGHAGTNPLIVKVNARQFEWKFTYPNGKSYGFMTLPKGRHVKLVITADDVIHSFWVPQLSQKQDAVPGHTTYLVITPTHIARYPVICTELCGLGHALMRSHVDILSAADYAKWVKAGAAANAGPPGLAVFQQNGCGGCHTFKPAAATGKVGPDLGNLAQEAKQAHRGALEAFIEESIVKPGAYIAPGFPNAMPPNFGTQIPPDKLKQLVQYLAKGPNQ